MSSDSKSNVPDSSGWSADRYNQCASFVYSSSFTSSVLELLAARPGEKIIDFGCGSGELLQEIQRIVFADGNRTGLAVGFDTSESMIEKTKANGLENTFVSDAQAVSLPPNLATIKFDAVFSNAALHWCKRDPKGVLESAKRVLKKDGRFVAEMGGFMNCIGVRSAIHRVLSKRGYDPQVLDPWYFPSVAEYTKLLQESSFRPIHVSLNPRFTPLPAGGLRAWLQTFVRNSFLKDFSDEEAEVVIEEVVGICVVDCRDKGLDGAEQGGWAMMYMRLRVFAILD